PSLAWALGARAQAPAADAPALLAPASDLPAGRDDELTSWIASQRDRSYRHLLRNVSPTAPFERDVESRFIAPERLDYVRAETARTGGRIRLHGDHVWQRIVPSPGSVSAAAPGPPSEPDYFFHWIRDSALVMRALATLQAAAPPAQAAQCAQHLGDFIRFSRTLQASASPESIGEPRFNMDGTPDILQWSRPQFDGPALRALTLMHYERVPATPLARDLSEMLAQVVDADLDYLAANWMRPSFDYWEENRGYDFHTRVVEAGALHAGARRALAAHNRGRADTYAAAEARLREALESHWLPARGYYGFHQVKSRPGDNFDTAIVIAALHSRLADGRYSLLDDRVLATMAKIEDLFSHLFPVNGTLADDEGLLYGRYVGDQYYGGGAWGMVTLEFAEAQYRLAALLAAHASLPVTPLNRTVFERALRRAGNGTNLGDQGDAFADAAVRRALLRGFVVRGDDILRTVRRFTPPTGDMPEQYDKNTGAPTSTSNLTWGHAAFLAATDARAKVADL
ncbi:glycoside hydrolase family 15 protein, partial [Zavarzinia sp.]|uniref:glycoside hydrolase family 15 protein n=1 Tax=Zavarzinia sp. TaxID=2027920 RepID=UPI00356981A8